MSPLQVMPSLVPADKLTFDMGMDLGLALKVDMKKTELCTLSSPGHLSAVPWQGFRGAGEKGAFSSVQLSSLNISPKHLQQISHPHYFQTLSQLDEN